MSLKQLRPDGPIFSDIYNFKYISDKKNETFKHMFDRYSNRYRNYEQRF